MSEVAKRILTQPIAPATSLLNLIFKVPLDTEAEQLWITSAIVLSNCDSIQHYVSLYQVGDGDVPSEDNKIFPASPIKANQVVEGARGWVFEPGDELWAEIDSEGQVNISIYYAERTV